MLTNIHIIVSFAQSISFEGIFLRQALAYKAAPPHQRTVSMPSSEAYKHIYEHSLMQRLSDNAANIRCIIATNDHFM